MISIVIPTLNEAEALPGLLRTLAAEQSEHEIIVVDGGSTDATVSEARRTGIQVQEALAGRGQQLRHGASLARGEILLFLHADSRFPAGGLEAIRRALDDPAVVGGNFRLVFDGEDRFAQWLTGFYGWIRRFGLYYGDSGIFVRRTAYEQMGGIRPIPLMEDLDFVSRLRRSGRTCRIENVHLVTSCRRFRGRRPIEIFLGWSQLHILFWLGVSPDRLARIYARQGSRCRGPDLDDTRTR